MKQLILFLTAMLLSCSSHSEVKAEVTDDRLTTLNDAEGQSTLDKMYITIDGQTQSVSLVENEATRALVEKLKQSPVNVTLNSSGNFEIWGALGFSLPTSNQQTTAQPGDVILYNGSNICLFYGTNSWSYTRLGKIDDLTEGELRSFLKAGENNISVTLSLSMATGITPTPFPKDEGNLKGEGNVYAVNGQRVQNALKGIYIKNGKKGITPVR